jgi:hypothetical protein
MARPKKTRATDSKTIVSTPDSSGGIDGGKVDKRARFKALLAARDYAAAVTLGRSVIDFDAEKSALQDQAFLKDWRRALIGAMECQRAARWSEELRQNIEFAESVGAMQPASALIRRLTDRWRWADFGAEEPDIITEDPPLNAVLLAVREMLLGDPAELDPTAYRKVVKRLLVVCDDLNQAHGRENPIGGQCEAIADLLRLACACRVGALSQASPRLIKFAKEHPRIGLLVDFSANRMVQLARYRLESWPDSRGRILVAIAMSKRGYSDYIAFDGDFDQAVLRVLPQNWIQGIPQIGVEAAAESAPPSKQGQLFSGEPFSQAESSQSRRGKKEVKRPGRKGAALEMHCDAILQTRSVTENSLTSLLKHLQRSKDVEVLAPDRMVSLLEKLLSQIEEQTGSSQFDLAVLSVDCTLRLIELIERSQLCQRALPRTVSLERVKAYLRETRLTLSSLSSHFIRQIFAYDQVLQELMAKDSPNDQVERRALAQRILEICQEVREGQPFYFKDIKIALQRALLQLAIQPVPDINFAERLVAVGPLPEDMRARLLKAFGEKAQRAGCS